MTTRRSDLGRLLKESLRLYFAPLTGACRGIAEEFRRIDRDIERRREGRPPSRREQERTV